MQNPHGHAVLDTIDGPAAVKLLAPERLPALAREIRDFLVSQVSRTGGHLGPNLGVVELTIALHRVFDSPRDRLLWDTGHQAYVHKILTGRHDFSRLRSRGGLSGYPSRAESGHDIIENSHASTALSYADGLAKAYRLSGESDRCVVAVVGDGALTGGMAWEALNNIALIKDFPLVIVVNDNGRSYARTRGGLADHLTSLRTTRRYEQILEWGKKGLRRTPGVGKPLYSALHGVKKGLKDLIAPQCLFEDLGLKYIGPVDGHDLKAVEGALWRAKRFGSPVIVHCITEKGRGHRPAEEHEADRFHAVDAAAARAKPSVDSWTSVFSDELVKVGTERPEVVAVTAAMLRPVGLAGFAEAYPERTFDVGIAEQHAVTSAAGLALGGMHPVVAVYATFLNRAFDQVLLDVALHRCGVTFVLDRAGATGNDGASHNGMWDLSILQVVPGLRIAVPRDGARLRQLLREAVAVEDAPTVVRFPKGAVSADHEAVAVENGLDVLARPAGTSDASGHSGAPAASDVLIVSVGAVADVCLAVAERLAQDGIRVTVVDPRWVKPVPEGLCELAAHHGLVATVEDNGRVGGAGSAVAQALKEASVHVPVRHFGLDQRFFEHGTREEVLEESGITPDGIARDIAATWEHLAEVRSRHHRENS